MFKNKIIMITGGTGSFGTAVLERFLSEDIKEIRWDVIILIIGGLSLGAGVVKTGLDEWLGMQFNIEGLSIYFIVLNF